MDETDRNLLDIIDPDSNYFLDNTINFTKYTIDDFYKSNINEANSLNIFHNNSRSLLKEGRIDEYNILLDCIKNPFQVLAFTETWLKPENVDLVNFSGFDSSHVIRPADDHFDLKDTRGGISIFIKEGLSYKVRINIL